MLKSPNDGFAMLSETDARDELQLQEELKEHPELLPLEDLGLTASALVVGRESTLDAGRVDLLLLASTGDLLLVEFKTGPQNPDFRSALAQLLDYGSDLWGMTLEDFTSRIVEPYFASARHPGGSVSQSLDQVAASTWTDLPADAVDWRDRLTTQLRDGSFHYVTVAQRFTPSMLRTLKYLNVTSKSARFSAVEMIRFEGSAHTAFEARVVAAAESTTSTTPQAKATLAGVEGLVAGITDDPYRHALEDLFASISEIDGLIVYWGTTGCSIRVLLEGRSPLSIGWVFPPGSQRTWMGLTDVTLGWYQDASGQGLSPERTAHLDAYLSQVSQLPGSMQPSSSSIHGRSLPPGTVISNAQEILAAIQQVTLGLTATT